MSTENPQVIRYYSGNEAGKYKSIQSISLNTNAGSVEITSDTENPDRIIKVQSSVPISVLGGNNIDVSYFATNNNPISMYTYTYGREKSFVVIGNDKKEFVGKVISDIPQSSALNRHTFPFWFSNSSNLMYPNSTDAFIVPVYVENEDLEVCVCISDDPDLINSRSLNIENFNDPTTPTVKERYGGNNDYTERQLVLKGSKRYYLVVKSTPDNKAVQTGELYLNIWSQGTGFVSINPACIIVGDPVMVYGLNKNLSTTLNTGFNNNPVLERIRALVSSCDHPGVKPNYLYQPDSSMAIDLERYKYVNAITGDYDMLAFDNPLILFDSNNVAHDMSIAEVDIANSVIDIARDMRSYN